ncbi:helix-turn-helix transcriptional regulator [Streptomyces silvensis]|uniref:Helix-turn-helix transcriptional regulator n=1 Tax=Streptomyces silvensis TaxID=1765722 RepID=A0A0W7WSC2_9ACTN|nr:LuxR C-terminal-related transcriptional regulator [Streptomyces silvensis]KUF13368.1 helix-turn-helix transcriptional regulator [Streptomyces silvensis]
MEHRSHDAGELCEAGRRIYVRALREGRLHAEEARAAPCLSDLGLLHPDSQDARSLRPTPPAVALPRLLGAIDTRITAQRRREARLADVFAPLMDLDRRWTSSSGDSAGATVIHGRLRINAAIDHVASKAQVEALAIQPGGSRSVDDLMGALPRTHGILSRGGRLRTLYQHTTRHSPPALAHYRDLDGDVEVRTLNELPDRLLVFDRRVAFLPVNKVRDTAVEIRQQAVVDYLVTVFDLLWRLAVPMWPTPAPQPASNGITPRQRAIAALLTDGLTDTEIAARLGMNVRTARVHIAKLSTFLNSSSRAQLGYLIGRSGILDQPA